MQGKPFYTGIVKGIPTTITISGIGKSNAAQTTSLMIHQYSPSIIVNLGVAGAYPSTSLCVGDLVIASTERYIDEGLYTSDERFLGMDVLGFDLGGQDGGTVFKLHIPQGLSHMKTGHFATVSTCTGSYKRGLKIVEEYGCVCESMEGAAIAHVCHYTNTPLVELRAISNIITDRKAGIDKNELITSAQTLQTFFFERIEDFLT